MDAASTTTTHRPWGHDSCCIPDACSLQVINAGTVIAYITHDDPLDIEARTERSDVASWWFVECISARKNPGELCTRGVFVIYL